MFRGFDFFCKLPRRAHLPPKSLARDSPTSEIQTLGHTGTYIISVLDAHSYPECLRLIQVPKWQKLSEASAAVGHMPFLLCPTSWMSSG